MRLVVIALAVAGCGHHAALVAPDREPELPAPTTGGDRYYTIWLGGGRIGTAHERERWSEGGVELSRRETLWFYRGDAIVNLVTEVVVDADRGLTPRRVSWSERNDREPPRGAHAERTADGRWITSSRAELPRDAIPSELVPLVIRRDGHFSGSVFLVARGFLVGRARIAPVAEDRTAGRLVAAISLAGGARVEATVDIDRAGDVVRVVDGEGVLAIRATPTQAATAFQPIDVIAAMAIPISGAPSDTIALAGSLAVPDVPGQRAHRDRDGVVVELARRGGNAGGRSGEIAELARRVHAAIAPDLAVRPGSPSDAATATAGDCTTFALAYAALAARRGIATRVVTGLRVDGDRLVRHRWAISWSGGSWIAVDAAYGDVPATATLIGLVAHSADDAGLVTGESALTQVRAASWR